MFLRPKRLPQYFSSSIVSSKNSYGNKKHKPIGLTIPAIHPLTSLILKKDDPVMKLSLPA
jgi:hypothetical protein